MNNNQNKWYLSGWFIVLMFIVFWPAGIALLIMRNAGNKNALFIGSTDKKKYIIAGIALIVLGLAMITESTIYGILMIAGGGALLYYSKTLTDKAARNRRYIDLIVNQKEGSIDNIAAVCNIPYDTAVKELKYLQTVGVLSNISIDEVNRTISLVQPEPSFINNAMNAFTQAGPQEEVTCTCPGCGAKVLLVRGSSAQCEYCDSPITAN